MGWKFGQKIIDIVRGKTICEFGQKIINTIIVKIKGVPKKHSHYGIHHIYTGVDAQRLVYNELLSDKASMICRFGSIELSIVNYFLRHKKNNIIKFTSRLKKMVEYNAGFFPATDYNLSRFSYEFIELIKNIDIISIWNLPNENKILNAYNQHAKYIYLEDLNVKYYNCHNYMQKYGATFSDFFFTQALEGKKVLVIHPFEDTIKSQYQKRELLFDNNLLPDFELKTIKAVQSIAGNKDLPYNNWFDALDSMKEQINKTDFDIAIIGCGAYGIFLADHIKSIGKKAIHMGGATQLLFGILGKRWEENYPFTFNEHWVRPSDAEKPQGAIKIEGGCYW